jgi:aspartate carbamoyltransferase regulatory subunit
LVAEFEGKKIPPIVKLQKRIAKTDIQLSISSKSHLSKDILKVIGMMWENKLGKTYCDKENN